MAEPRARQRAPDKQFFNSDDLTELLRAFGSNEPHLSGTVSVLDEILKDFIIETCHGAALCASYSRRQKIKVDDFKWVLRKDERLLGRVLEQLWKEKAIKIERKAVDLEKMGKEGVEELEGIAEMGGVAGEARKRKGRGRGKRKAEDSDEGPSRKRLMS